MTRCIEKIQDGSNRVVGIRLLSNNSATPDVLVLSVYMPCLGSPIAEFKDIMCELQEILMKYGDHNIILGGDLNDSLHRFPRGRHDKLLLLRIVDSPYHSVKVTQLRPHMILIIMNIRA